MNGAMSTGADMTGNIQIKLTEDYRYRGRAMAVPGAYWSKQHKAFMADNPDPRAAAAIIALFPAALVEHPELSTIRDSVYGTARPYNYADEADLALDVEGFPIKLYDWQNTDGGYLLAIMERDKSAHVAWDRGLGKTVITAAFIHKLEAQRTLIVARNEAKDFVWLPELDRLLPDHQILVLPDASQATKRDKLLTYLEEDWESGSRRRQSGGNPTDYPLVLIVHYQAIRTIAGNQEIKHRDGTSDIVKAAGDGWKRLGHWDLMVYDEAHRLASYNPNSRKNTQEGRALSTLRRKHVDKALALTGSAVMNHAEDLFGQLHYLYPDRYRAKWRDWNNRFIDYVDDGNRKVPIGFRVDKLPELRRELGVFMVHRKKAEVFDLPPLIHQNIELELYPKQRRAYEQMRDEFWAQIEGGGFVAVNAMDQLSKLRQIATWVEGLDSIKLDFAYDEIMEEADAQFVVFTWYKAPGRALAARLGNESVVVDGNVPSKQRADLLRRHKRGQARVLVGSIATLGESLNLQYAHEAIRLDRHWNPEVNAQTTDRLYRNGQQARVTLRDLWAKNTVDTLRVRPNLASKESLRKAVFG